MRYLASLEDALGIGSTSAESDSDDEAGSEEDDVDQADARPLRPGQARVLRSSTLSQRRRIDSKKRSGKSDSPSSLIPLSVRPLLFHPFSR